MNIIRYTLPADTTVPNGTRSFRVEGHKLWSVRGVFATLTNAAAAVAAGVNLDISTPQNALLFRYVAGQVLAGENGQVTMAVNGDTNTLRPIAGAVSMCTGLGEIWWKEDAIVSVSFIGGDANTVLTTAHLYLHFAP
jgi:hypothetical protein